MLVVQEGRDSENVVWTGEQGAVWDLMNTENFSSSDKKFVTGDDVTFDDNATETNVNVAENITPGSIVFKNNDKSYTISGNGAIEGDAQLVVEGTGTVSINNTNRYSGGTIVRNGTLSPSSLTNNDGLEYGALGDARNTITLENNGRLKTTSDMTSSHIIVIGDKGGIINTTGTLILNGGIKKAADGKNRDLKKEGKGTLQLNSPADYDKLYLNEGKVYDFSDSHFNGKTVVLNGNKVILQAENSIYSSNSDNMDIEVPEGKTGTWYPDGRCDYTGRLTGAGTIEIYATWVRCPFKGDWSSFTGTINAKRGTKNAYEPVFDFNNTYGIPHATLNVDSRFTKDTPFNTSGKSFAIGALTGSGYISNGGYYGSSANTLTIGGKNTDFTFSGSINGSNVVKDGTGVWTISSENVLGNAKSLKIIGGAVRLNKATATRSMTSPTIAYVQDGGELRGLGYAYGVNLLGGGSLRPGSYAPENQNKNTGFIYIQKNLNAEAGSNIYMNKTKADSLSTNNVTGARSQAWAFVKVGGNATLNGTVNVSYGTSWTPSEGDYVRIIQCDGTISGSPTFNLQPLPAGLGWDTSGILTEGIIRVTTSTGISDVSPDLTFEADVYTIGGRKVLTGIRSRRETASSVLMGYGLPAGIYIVVTPDGGIKVPVR